MTFTDILKLINLCAIVLFYRQYKKKEEDPKTVEEEEKDPNTWYTVNNGQSRYKGEWKNGVPHGKGTNEIFEGDHRDAEGKPCDSNGKSCCWCLFECDFVDGHIEGYGKQTFKQEEGEATQPYYEGEFKNGMQHGQGAYYYGTGEYHKGNFKESKFHGVGYHYYVKVNKTWVGEFDNDNLTKGMFIQGKIDEEEDDDCVFDEYEFRSEQLRRLRAYNKKNENETEDEYAERILDMAYNEDKAEKRRKGASLEEEPVANEDMETLYIYDFEGTGEQLRRLRAYNKKNDEETEDEYTNRIWNIADKEDEEEKLKKAQKAANELVENANEIVVDEPLENDVNTWYITNKGKYKGEWKNGLPNGKGIYEFTATNSIIECNFVDGIAYGYGRQIFEKAWDEKTVPYYEGEFKKNHYDGKGEYHYGDGRYYKGEFKDSKYHGQGAEYSHIMRKTWVGEYYNDEKMKGEWM